MVMMRRVWVTGRAETQHSVVVDLTEVMGQGVTVTEVTDLSRVNHSVSGTRVLVRVLAGAELPLVVVHVRPDSVYTQYMAVSRTPA